MPDVQFASRIPSNDNTTGGSAAVEAAPSALHRRLRGASYEEGAAVLEPAAPVGAMGPSVGLPHASTIQPLFGHHDIGGVRAHIGGLAAEVAAAIGAHAFTSGDDVCFVEAPDLFLATHEAAHVVQQRMGRAPSGGVGSPGDAFEQQADRAAAAVVAGESAEAILDEAAGGGGGGEAIQKTADDRSMGDRVSQKDLYPGADHGMLGKQDMAYHHIVDDHSLRKFWNTVVARQELGLFGGTARHILDKGMETFGKKRLLKPDDDKEKIARDVQDNDGTVIDADDFDAVLDPAKNPKLSEAEAAAAATFEIMYQWMPGNLMHGPSNRTDDPGDAFETGAAGIVPNHPEMKTMNDQMQTYITSAQHGQALTDAFDDVEKGVRSCMARSQPYPFVEAQWDKTPGATVKDATWKIK